MSKVNKSIGGQLTSDKAKDEAEQDETSLAK
jgi:hypothetical protein